MELDILRYTVTETYQRNYRPNYVMLLYFIVGRKVLRRPTRTYSHRDRGLLARRSSLLSPDRTGHVFTVTRRSTFTNAPSERSARVSNSLIYKKPQASAAFLFGIARLERDDVMGGRFGSVVGG